MEAAIDPLKVTVAQAGEYYIDDQKYDLDGAIAELAAEHAVEPLRRLVLRADARLTYGQVRELFARAQQVGFPGLSLHGRRAPQARDGAGCGRRSAGGAGRGADRRTDEEG